MDSEIKRKMIILLSKYFRGHSPNGFPSEENIQGRLILSAEIVAGIQLLLDDPEIEYSEWWDELHELLMDEYFDYIDDIQKDSNIDWL